MTDNVRQYHYVSQGKIEIAGVDDGEEFLVTDVSSFSLHAFPVLLVITVACPFVTLCGYLFSSERSNAIDVCFAVIESL